MRKQLFSFIHSLTKQEKRYFKLYSSQLGGEEGNMYTYLFDLIENNDGADEEFIKMEYLKKFDLKTYISTKFYLKVKLLETLRLMQEHIHPNVEQEIRQLMENAALFYQKDFKELCEKEILHAEKLAKENELWDKLYSIIEKKLAIYYDIFINNKKMDEEQLQTMIAQKNQALQYWKTENDISNLIHEIKFYLRKWDSTDKNGYMVATLNSEILQQAPQGIRAQIGYHLAKALINKFLMNQEVYCDNYQRIFELWQQNQAIKEFDIKYYLMSCSNYITALVTAKKMAEAQAVLAHLQNEALYLRKRLPDPQDIDPPILHAQKVVYLHTANYAALIEMEKKAAPFLIPGNPYFHKTTIIEIRYALGYAHFKTQNYKQALNHLNEIILNQEMLHYSTIFQIHSLSVVYLLCHYELGNIKFLNYEIERQKELMNKLKANDDVSNNFFKLLSKLLKYPTPQRDILLKYLPVFQAYETENPKSTIFLSVVNWIQGKLNALETP
jgi:hypothetical protein